MNNTITCKNNFGEIVSIPKEKFFFRPSVYGLIVDGGKIVTMTNKSNGKYWFPGGGIEIGEQMEDALKREIREECGLEVEIGEMVLFKQNFFYYQPLDHAYHAFLFFFICTAKNTGLLPDDKLDPEEESRKPRWTKISDIKKEQIGDIEEDLFPVLQGLI